MSLSNYSENRLLDYLLGNGTPATVYVFLSTADPGEAGAGLAEPSGGSYARVAVTNNSTNWPAASGGVKSNGAVITFPQATGSWGTVTHWGIYDASSGGNLLLSAPLTVSKAVTTGDTPEFGVGDLDVSLD